MKFYYLIIIATIISSGLKSYCFGQKFDVEEIMINGQKDKRINLVFLGDGYRESELDKYIEDVNKMVDETFIQTPFKEYKKYFNVYAVKVPSNVSGAAMDPQNLIDNYFGSSYGVSGIDRLLVPTRTQKVVQVIADNFPEYHQIFVVVNHDKYGGSGGQFATSSTNASAGEIAIHEIGHSFAGLADEYWYMAQEKDNQTSNNNPQTIRWKNWLNDEGIGIYEHSGDGAGNYKPHQNCKMQFLGKPFCAVCKESFTWKIHELSSPIESYDPEDEEVDISSGKIDFSLELLEPVPNTLKVQWKLNDKVVLTNKAVFSIAKGDLKEGDNVLEASILDTTLLTRRNNHASEHVHFVKWTIHNLPVGIFTNVNTFSMQLSLYPNPVHNVLNIQYGFSENGNASLSILDLTGREIDRLKNTRLNSGTFEEKIDLNKLNLLPGYYLVKLNLDNSTVTKKFLKL